MPRTQDIRRRLQTVFTEARAEVLTEVISDAHDDLVKAGDFNELKEIVRELAQAQGRTETRVEELAQAQGRTEASVRALTLNVNRLEVSVDKLVGAVRATNQQVGALSHAVGYRLEDESYKALPDLLLRDYGIEVQGRLLRKHVEVESGEFVEINILGEAIREGKPLTIVGEAKTQLHRRDLLRFLADRVEPARKIFPEVFPVLVTYMTTAPDLEEEVRESGVALYYSFDLG